MLNSKLEYLMGHFGISKIADWQDVEPAWVISQPGIGPKTLDYLRLLLASHGFTLKGDATPEHWKRHIPKATIVDQITDVDDGEDRGVMCPFTVLIDTAEQQPFSFAGIRGDADVGGRPIIVPTEPQCLGRHPDSLGDYSLTGGKGRCHVERKSMDDAHGTILGWGDRRERFEKELENLSEIEAGAVVVECSLGELIRCAPELPKTSAARNAKSLFRSVMSFQRRYSVRWIFCDSRRLAELATFRWLLDWHEEQIETRKATEKESRREARKEQAQATLAGM
jgi:hypothetical protein